MSFLAPSNATDRIFRTRSSQLAQQDGLGVMASHVCVFLMLARKSESLTECELFFLLLQRSEETEEGVSQTFCFGVDLPQSY